MAACVPNLPNEQQVRKNFEAHRPEYVRLASLIQNDQSARFIDADGNVDVDGSKRRLVPLYRDLLHKIGVKKVFVREDGSMEFALGGHGCVTCSDSYTGVRYYPKAAKRGVGAGWMQTNVASLDGAALPQEKGKVASGLYAVSIEPDWYAYRFEYQE